MLPCCLSPLARAYAATYEDVECCMNTGDVVIVDSDQRAAIVVVRGGGAAVAAWTSAGLVDMHEFCTTSSLLILRRLTFSSQRRAERVSRMLMELIDAERVAEARRQPLAAAALHALREAGGPSALPRSPAYGESDHRLLCAVSSAYLVVYTYIRMTLARPTKSLNLYDCEDLLFGGDFDHSLVDGTSLGRDAYFTGTSPHYRYQRRHV